MLEPISRPRAVESAPVVLIPTLFAKLHAEIRACDDRAQLIEASVHMNAEMWNVSPWAHRRLDIAMRDRCHQIWRAQA